MWCHLSSCFHSENMCLTHVIRPGYPQEYDTFYSHHARVTPNSWPIKPQAGKMEVLLVTKVGQFVPQRLESKAILRVKYTWVNKPPNCIPDDSKSNNQSQVTPHWTTFLIMWHQIPFQASVTLNWLGLKRLRKGSLENAILWICLTKG